MPIAAGSLSVRPFLRPVSWAPQRGEPGRDEVHLLLQFTSRGIVLDKGQHKNRRWWANPA